MRNPVVPKCGPDRERGLWGSHRRRRNSRRADSQKNERTTLASTYRMRRSRRRRTPRAPPPPGPRLGSSSRASTRPQRFPFVVANANAQAPGFACLLIASVLAASACQSGHKAASSTAVRANARRNKAGTTTKEGISVIRQKRSWYNSDMRRRCLRFAAARSSGRRSPASPRPGDRRRDAPRSNSAGARSG